MTFSSGRKGKVARERVENKHLPERRGLPPSPHVPLLVPISPPKTRPRSCVSAPLVYSTCPTENQIDTGIETPTSSFVLTFDEWSEGRRVTGDPSSSTAIGGALLAAESMLMELASVMGM